MEYVLEVKNLTVSYPIGWGKSKLALDHFSMEVPKGNIVGLLGPNGAGKTTLIKTVLGLIYPQGGKVTLCGENPPSTGVRARLGYQPEVSTYYWFLTPQELLSMYGGLCGMAREEIRQRTDYVLDLVGLTDEKKRLIRTFSKGMHHRLGLTQALLHNPEFLILDEPFSGLDPLGRVQVREILKGLRGEGKTILLSSHELSEAELVCDQVCIMKEGRTLKSGPLTELLKEKGEESLEGYFLGVVGEKT